MTESFSSSIVKITTDGQVVISDYLDDGETIYSPEAQHELAEKQRTSHDEAAYEAPAEDQGGAAEQGNAPTENHNEDGTPVNAEDENKNEAFVPANPENADDSRQGETLQPVPEEEAEDRKSNAEADDETKTSKH